MTWRERGERVFGLVAKEFRQVFRDPRMARVVFVSPMIQLMIFGYAVTTDIRNTATFVVDLDGTQASRELVEQLTASGHFAVTARSSRPADLVRALDHGDAIVGVEIPRGFQRDLDAGRPTEVQLLFDGTNANTAAVAQGYAARIVQDFAGGHSAPGVVTAGAPPLELRTRAWYNPNLESRDYNVPGVVGALIMLVCLLLTSLAIVREREIGTLEQLRVSPLSAGELIAGKTLPFAIIGMFDLALVTTVAVAWFGIPLRGSLLLLAGASLLYVLSGLAMGLFVSTVSATQQEAFMTTFLIFMPALLLSGFMFPVSSMPEVFQTLTLLNPVRHYIEVVRAVFLKGAGVPTLWPQLLWLAGLGSVLLTAATLRFRRELA
ncbi:MAG: ABC transporter permease [Gemmatimonadetes bacterium]|nr:MAG: ABC transporter permease [Gemmatimonadota bacterium]